MLHLRLEKKTKDHHHIKYINNRLRWQNKEISNHRMEKVTLAIKNARIVISDPKNPENDILIQFLEKKTVIW